MFASYKTFLLSCQTVSWMWPHFTQIMVHNAMYNSLMTYLAAGLCLVVLLCFGRSVLIHSKQCCVRIFRLLHLLSSSSTPSSPLMSIVYLPISCLLPSCLLLNRNRRGVRSYFFLPHFLVAYTFASLLTSWMWGSSPTCMWRIPSWSSMIGITYCAMMKMLRGSSTGSIVAGVECNCRVVSVLRQIFHLFAILKK